MRKLSLLIVVLFALTTGSFAQQAASPPENRDRSHLRHVYVPVESLDSVLKSDKFAAVMTRSDFEELVRQARDRLSPAIPAAQPPAVTSAVHRARIDGERLIADVEVQLVSFAEAAEADLRVAGWNVESAIMNGMPARLTRVGKDLNTLRVFLPNPGPHVLTLRLTCAMRVAGSDQLASFEALGAASERVLLTLPAGKFLNVNGLSLVRPAAGDQSADYEVPIGGLPRVAITITDRRQTSRSDRLTFASTAFGVRVSPSEITWTARTELQVFGDEIDRLVCHVPQSLEITAVESTGLESWELSDSQDQPGRMLITLRYRQGFAGAREILLRGILSEPPSQPWDVPSLVILGATSHAGSILILHSPDVRLQLLEANGVRTTPAAASEPVFSGKSPLVHRRTAPMEAPHSRLFYEVWREDFRLRFVAALKEQQVQAAMTSLLDVTADGLDLSTTLSLQTRLAPLFDVHIRIPAEYRVLSAKVGNEDVVWETVPDVAGINEIRIPLDPPLSPGQVRTVSLTAHFDPEAWPVGQSPVRIRLPEARLPQAAMVEALYGISGADDLEVVPVEVAGLDPAGRQEIDSLNQRLSGTNQHVRLGFTYQDTVISGQLEVSRKPPLLTTRTLTFFRVDRETVFARIESQLAVSGGGIRELTVQVSESAGDRLRFSIAPINQASTLPSRSASPSARLVEQTPGTPVNGMRPWTLRFDRYLNGNYLLTTEVQLPRAGAVLQPQTETPSFAPPQVVFPQADANSGFVAVEGATDEHVQITAQGADGQPLPTVDPVDFPQGRYRPQQRVVAGYRYVQPGWTMNVTTTTFDRAAVPTAIGHNLEIDSVLGRAGILQHRAQLTFTAYGMQSLLVKMPQQASLWTALVDKQAIELRRVEEGIRIPLKRLDPQRQHTLELLYATPAQLDESLGALQATPPTMTVISGTGAEQPLEILKQSWRLHYPHELLLVDSQGAFRPAERFTGETWWGSLWKVFRMPTADNLLASGIALVIAAGALWLVALAWRRLASSGCSTRLVEWFMVAAILVVLVALLMPARQSAREAARRTLERSSDRERSAPPAESMIEMPANKVQLASPSPQLAPDSSSGRVLLSQVAPPQQSGPDLDMPFRQGSFDLAAPQSGGFDSGLLGAKQSAFGGGLLSLAFGLQVPDDTNSQQFEYQGNGLAPGQLDLHVQYVNHTAVCALVSVMALGIVLLSWWLRNSRTTIKLVWVFLTIFVPLALLGVVPILWQLPLQGVIIGGLLTLAGWLVVGCQHWCFKAWTSLDQWVQGAKWFILLAALSAWSVSSRAGEPEPAPPADPYVVIPYASLKDLSAADRVWIPTRLYQQLWRAAHPEDFDPPAASVPHTVAEANYAARLEEDKAGHRVVVQARWVIVNFTNHEQSIPLPILSGGVREATINGDSAALVPGADQQVSVIVPNRGVHVVDAQLDLPADVNRAVGQFQFNLQPAAAGMFTFNLPSHDEKLRVRVNGASDAFQRIRNDQMDRIEIPIDRGGMLTVAWQPERQQQDVGNLVQVETAVAAAVEDDGVELNHASLIRVRQGAINDIVFDVPAGVAVREIRGPDVAGWELNVIEQSRSLRVFFRRQVSDETRVEADVFQARQIGQMAESIAVNSLAPQGVAREIGFLAVYVPDHLRLRVVQMQGMQQVDVSQFQPVEGLRHPQSAPQAAYRFSSRPFSLNLEVLRRAAETRATVEHGVQIGRRKVLIASRILLDVAGAPQRVVEIALPADYLTMDVVCPGASDWYVRDGDDGRQLVVELDQPRTGTIEIGLEGHIVKQPGDASVEVSVPQPVGVARLNATLGAWIDQTYQPSLAEIGNWRSMTTSELPETTQRLRPQSAPFALRATGRLTALRFNLQQAVPAVTADAGVLIAAGDATIDYGLTIRWNIANAAADEFAFTAPDWLTNLEFTGPGIRQTRPARLPDGRTRWTISLIDPARDQYLITAAATVPLPQDRIVRTPQLEFESVGATGEIAPLQTQRQFAVLVNLSQGQLAAVDQGQFEPVSADQLPLKMPEPLVRQAMEITRVRAGKVPTWRNERIEPAGQASAVVLSANLRTMIEMDGSWRTRAIYGVRNRGRQFLGLRLPEGARVLSVFVRGNASRTVVTTLGTETIHLVALPQTSEADLSFDIEVLLAGRLSAPLSDNAALTSRRISLPAPQVVSSSESAEFGLTVAQTLWTVYVPEELDAAPLERVNQTNLTWHRRRAWLAEEQQFLERLRTDVAEMARIVGDTRSSVSQRKQAAQNLRQLESTLKSRQPTSGEPFGSTDPEFQQVQTVQGRLIEEATKALSAAKDFDGDGVSVEKSELGNREYIESQNEAVITNNQLDMPALRDKSSENLNFYDEKDSRRSKSLKGNFEDGVRLDNADRLQLKEQLAKQAPIVKAAPTKSDFAYQHGGIGGGRGSGVELGEDFNILRESAGQSTTSTEAVPVISSTPWSAVGGLSVPMTLPVGGQELSFSKVGGSPQLTLSIRPKQTWGLLLGGLWCLVTLALGLWVLRRMARGATTAGVLEALSLFGVVIGVAGFLLFPADVRWMFFTIFCGAGLVLVLLRSRLASANSRSIT